jgi:hypothetical protein
MKTLAALLLAAALGGSAAAETDPLAAKTAEWTARGFTVKQRAETRQGPLLLAAVVYGAADGSGDRLEAYVVLKGKAYLGYAHPSDHDRLELDESPEGRGFHDLLKDGSPAFAYHATIRALNASSLEVVRFRLKSFKWDRAGEFPEGRFLSDGDETLVFSRDLPLGRFLSVGCEDFGTTSQSAFRARLFAASKGRYADVSSKHPEFYAAEIKRKEKAIERLRGDLQKNAGEYLGLALSLYYDYSARGEARKGWDRQKEFFQIPGFAPPSVKACFDSMRASLRGRLGVPADWP